jgi:hypothetical protein
MPFSSGVPAHERRAGPSICPLRPSLRAGTEILFMLNVHSAGGAPTHESRHMLCRNMLRPLLGRGPGKPFTLLPPTFQSRGSGLNAEFDGTLDALGTDGSIGGLPRNVLARGGVTLGLGRDVTVGLAEGDSEPDFPLGGFPAGIFDECQDGPTGPSASFPVTRAGG